MKYYHPINLWAASEPEIVPSMSYQRMRFECAHCHRTTQIAVPTEFHDWESVAKQYQERLQECHDTMTQAIADIEMIHGTENPVSQFYRNQWAMLWLSVQEKFGQRPKGTSAHERTGGEDENEGWKYA